MSAVPKFRIDCDLHEQLMTSPSKGPQPPTPKALTLPEPTFPKYPDKLSDPGPDSPPEKRDWSLSQLTQMKKGCERHCFSTLNHNLAYYYNEAWVIRFVWKQIAHELLKIGASSCPE